MITPELEKAIHCGKAVYKTFTFGGSGVGTVPVPKNKWIVITDFDYFFFSDVPGDLTPDQLQRFITRRSVYQLKFQSIKSTNHFIIRNNMNITFSELLGTLVVLPSGVFQRNTYLVHTADVHVNIINVRSVEDWAMTYSTLPPKSQEESTPAGYGIGVAGQPAVRQIIFDSDGIPPDTQQYFPLTQRRDQFPITDYREQFRTDVDVISKLDSPFQTGAYAERGNYAYPIVNVGYVEMQSPPTFTTNPSN